MSVFKITLFFKINFKTEFGKSIYVIGNISDLGDWKIENGIRLNWNEVYYLFIK